MVVRGDVDDQNHNVSVDDLSNRRTVTGISSCSLFRDACTSRVVQRYRFPGCLMGTGFRRNDVRGSDGLCEVGCLCLVAGISER